jgi:DNA-binding NarL/FixJ family response regulator
MSTPTLQPEALQVLCIVRQSNLFDALSQTLSNYYLPVHCLGVSTQKEFSTAMESPPDLIFADPYAFKQSNAIAYYKALHFRTGNIPLIALLPNGSPEYRDAAIQMGANHTLAWDKISSDLLPVMKRLLGRTRLIKGISKHIENSAEFSAPLGEPALKQDKSNLGCSRESLERLKVRKTNLDEMLTQDLYPTQGTIPIQSVYLRGLGTSAVSKVPSDDKHVFRTVCAHNCGPHFCGLNVTVRGQEITKIEPANFPNEQYRRLCMKGISYVQTRVSQQRLHRPLKRVGKRGEGKWEAVSWGQDLMKLQEKCVISAKFTDQKAICF